MEFLKEKFKWILSLFLTVFLMASSFLGCTLEDLDSFLGNEETITAENQNETTTNNNIANSTNNSSSEENLKEDISESKEYSSKEEVAAYINKYNKLH